MSKRRPIKDQALDEQLDDLLPNEELWQDGDEPKSKSQLKRDSDALQTLGRELVELSDKDLAKIPLSDDLLDAIKLAHKIQNKRGGYRRQLQFIGKLMRSEDPEPIRTALDAIRQTGQQSTAKFHALERWRDRIIAEGQSALDEFVEQHPQADRQQLRQLLLNIQREQKQNKPPKSARALFRYLRELSEEQDET